MEFEIRRLTFDELSHLLDFLDGPNIDGEHLVVQRELTA
jgi:hypothetical protein